MSKHSDHLRDAEQTTKDRAYSPASERETAAKQEAPGEGGLLPGTGGPDDAGDLPVTDDELDAATVVDRSRTGRRPGDG